MDRITATRIGALLALASVTAACATDKSLDDLALISVRRVAPTDKPLLHFIDERDEPLLAIEFSTGEDLTAFAQDRDSVLHGKVFFCENEKALRVESDPRVYDRKGEITGRHSYVVTVRTKVDTPEPGAIAYDLERDPRDLCLILRGGNVVGRTIASNVVTIPNAAIREALGK